jgi:phage/plasmid-like protein (TIGR03299 family)
LVDLEIYIRQQWIGQEPKKVDFKITFDELLDLFNSQSKRCSLTGLKFDFNPIGKKEWNPYAPSLDRIIPKFGYVNGNIRLVLVIVNLALNVFGDEVFDHMCRSYIFNKYMINVEKDSNNLKVKKEASEDLTPQNLITKEGESKMAHNFESGFVLREQAWHGLATVVSEAPTVEDGIVIAGLNWNVAISDMKIAMTGENSGYRSIVRMDNNKELGVVGARYHALQNIEAFSFFNPFIESGLVELETAGSLLGGQKVWVQAIIKNVNIEIGKNDVLQRRILLSNGHDGKTGIGVGFIERRVVCENTLNVALTSKSSKIIKVKHTANVKGNVQAVFDIMNLVNQEFEATEQQYRYLASQDINQADLEKYVKLIFGKEDKKLKLKEDDEMAINSNRVVSKVLAMWDQNKDVTPNNWWGSYNLINTYLCHEDGRSQEGRLNKMWFGESARKDKQALELALKMADKRVNNKLVTV